MATNTEKIARAFQNLIRASARKNWRRVMYWSRRGVSLNRRPLTNTNK
jgi:hypothetical protein